MQPAEFLLGVALGFAFGAGATALFFAHWLG